MGKKKKIEFNKYLIKFGKYTEIFHPALLCEKPK
jgi:hypothetical protein